MHVIRNSMLFYYNGSQPMVWRPPKEKGEGSPDNLRQVFFSDFSLHVCSWWQSPSVGQHWSVSSTIGRIAMKWMRFGKHMHVLSGWFSITEVISLHFIQHQTLSLPNTLATLKISLSASAVLCVQYICIPAKKKHLIWWTWWTSHLLKNQHVTIVNVSMLACWY